VRAAALAWPRPRGDASECPAKPCRLHRCLFRLGRHPQAPGSVYVAAGEPEVPARVPSPTARLFRDSVPLARHHAVAPGTS